MAYTMVEQVKIRLKQFHIDADDSVVFDHKEDNPLIEQLVEQAPQVVPLLHLSGPPLGGQSAELLQHLPTQAIPGAAG